MNLNPVKKLGARVFDAVGINSLGYFIQRAFFSPFIRIVNYHNLTQEMIPNFDEHLKYFSSRYVNVNREQLEEFLESGKWPHKKPGIILSFDDGMRSHSEIVVPMLDKYGFTGWFFVPSGWVFDVDGVPRELPDTVGGNVVLSHTQLRHLDKDHLVGCHSETHNRLGENLGPERLKYETLGAQESLGQLLGHPVDMFCWVGGEEESYSKTASDFVRQGFKLGFMMNMSIVRPGNDRFQLQRNNIEGDYPLWLVRFQISGIMDVVYYPKRKRVNELTK